MACLRRSDGGPASWLATQVDTARGVWDAVHHAVARALAGLSYGVAGCAERLARPGNFWVECWVYCGGNEIVNIDTQDLISVTEASNRGVSRLIQDAAQGRTQVVLRNNKAVAAVVSMDAVERLARLEELEDDLRLLSVALARTVTDSGRRYSLEEVAAELGVDLDTLTDED
jgi:antitoxin (DNA-binding transcriptional repressor) of toxin-antitoxin stability system